MYPNRIIVFLKDSNGNIVQQSLEYSGCFNEDLIINPNGEFKFDLEIEEGYTLIDSKRIIFKYSDTDFSNSEFKEYDLKFFEEI